MSCNMQSRVSDAAGAETSAAAAASVPVAAPLLDTSMHAAQTQARTQHKPPCQAASLKAAVALVGEPFHCPASSAEGE